jgi:hypothetical protein
VENNFGRCVSEARLHFAQGSKQPPVHNVRALDLTCPVGDQQISWDSHTCRLCASSVIARAALGLHRAQEKYSVVARSDVEKQSRNSQAGCIAADQNIECPHSFSNVVAAQGLLRTTGTT